MPRRLPRAAMMGASAGGASEAPAMNLELEAAAQGAFALPPLAAGAARAGLRADLGRPQHRALAPGEPGPVVRELDTQLTNKSINPASTRRLAPAGWSVAKEMRHSGTLLPWHYRPTLAWAIIPMPQWGS